MRLVVFSDLDGTLLDHHSYDWSAARPALAALSERGVPVVLASSKTAAEIADLRAAMGLDGWPAIVENGAAVLWSGAGQAAPDNSAWHRLRARLAQLPDDLRKGFRGFGDMGVEELARATGLTPAQATLAQLRCHSEPGLWHGDEAGLARFLEALSAHGITARRGGRFLTLSFGGTKAERMRELAENLGAGITIALGDAPNDMEMLESADFGVIIRNDHGPGVPRLAGEATGRIRRSQAPGPEGWAQEIQALLAEVDTGKKGAGRNG